MDRAILILAHDNGEDGEPDSESVARLEAAQCQFDRASCVVLAGYERHNQSMRRWLERSGNRSLPIHCVIAHDTIGQAAFTAPVLHALGIEKLTVVTSEYHLARTRVIFSRVYGSRFALEFVGADHALPNPAEVARHERESLDLFNEKFKSAKTAFDFMAILFDHHPRYQRIHVRSVDPDPDGEDSRLIWCWRNDPLTRAMSRATDEISWESHRDFYAKAVADSERALLIACVNAIPAAMLRFDLGDARAEISINLNPAMRGKGLARSILQAGCAYGFGSLGLDKMHAEIKPENARSVRIFEGVGFVRQSQGAGTHLYVLDGPGL